MSKKSTIILSVSVVLALFIIIGGAVNIYYKWWMRVNSYDMGQEFHIKVPYDEYALGRTSDSQGREIYAQSILILFNEDAPQAQRDAVIAKFGFQPMNLEQYKGNWKVLYIPSSSGKKIEVIIQQLKKETLIKDAAVHPVEY